MSLFWKLFVSVGIAMALTLIGSIYISFRLAELAFDQLNIENREIVSERASMVLAAGGEDALREWLRSNPAPSPTITVMILDESGSDLLGRELPAWYQRLVRRAARFSGSERPPEPPRGRARNFRPPQPFTRIVAPTGEEYRLLFFQDRITVLGFLSWPATQLSLLVLAVIAAAITSLSLARYLSSPIMRLQRATRALAAGALETRVGGPFVRRKDEVGTLARDFDQMATQIQQLITDKEALMRDVSHELRSPLARIRVALALAERKAGPDAKPDLSRIEQEAERLDQLIGQILTLSRLRSEPIDRDASIDIHALVSDVIADAVFEHPNTEISLEAEAVPTVRGNLAELTSAFENVLRNALSYGGTDNQIRVRLAADAGHVVISVADKGPGVNQDALERIFEPFYRVDESRNHQHKGHGLGLAISSSIVKRHDGRIHARNRDGGGLEVILELPAAN